MSHPIYYSSIINEALLIEQLASASEKHILNLRGSFSTSKPESYSVSEFEIELSNYHEWLSDTVSCNLIQCATRTRVLQDSSDFSIEESDYCPDREAYEAFSNIVDAVDFNFKPSLRECCNKIIHATQYELELECSELGDEYWTGVCKLKGKFGKKDWFIRLNTIQFCFALRYYISNVKHL